jgi:dTDP-glucose pyrophosphorylase/predicted transcriptional regulator
MMKNINSIKIYANTTIKEALKVISKGDIQIALVVSKKDKLIGTLTDGDIRRGFLKGLNIKSSIKTIYYKKPIVGKIYDSKEKLLKIALSKRILQIPIIDGRGKVLGIHVINDLLKTKNKSNLVILMAGGRGIRLRPLTKNLPKPMLKVGNKPILEILLERFKENGFSNFLISVNYKSKIIKRYFGNGQKFGVKINYIEEKKKMGTAGCLSLLKKKPDKAFFVANGDLLTNLDFEKMLHFHYNHNSKATMAIKEYNINSLYGEVKVKNENIYSIVEKPIYKFFINAGAYIIEPEYLKLIPKKFYDMTSFFKKIIEMKIMAKPFPIDEFWLDIGRHADYVKANDEYNSLIKNLKKT